MCIICEVSVYGTVGSGELVLEVWRIVDHVQDESIIVERVSVCW